LEDNQKVPELVTILALADGSAAAAEGIREPWARVTDHRDQAKGRTEANGHNKGE
jgi:hypothetical protein